VALAAVGGWAAAALAPRDFSVGTFQDDAQYAVLAKAIREQHTYRSLEYPGHPPELKFPPGWPAVLALAWKPGLADTANLDRLRWVNLALVGPLAAAVALAGMQVFGLPAALSAVAAVAGVVAPAELTWWTIPMSEPFCLTLLALGLVLAEKGRTRGAAATLAAAAYVRTVAAPFLVAVVAVAAWKQGWRRAVAPALIGLAMLAPWLVHVALNVHTIPPILRVSGYGTYADQFTQGLFADPLTVLVTVPWVNGPMVVQALGQAVLGWPWAPRLVELVLGILVTWLVVRAGRGHPVFWIGMVLYVLTVLWWPFPQEDRFLGSVWPLLLVAALAGLPWARVRWAVAAAVAVLAVVAFAQGRGVERHRERSRSTLALADSLRPRLPAGAVLSVSDPPLAYLQLGHLTAPNFRERTYRWYERGYWATAWGLGDDLWAIVRAFHPDYLIVERRGAEGRYAAGSLMRQCPGVLEQIWNTPGGEYLFKIHGDVACAPRTVEP